MKIFGSFILIGFLSAYMYSLCKEGIGEYVREENIAEFYKKAPYVANYSELKDKMI